MNASQRIIISGASGLIGGALAASLRADGVPVVRLVRRSANGADEIAWDPSTGSLDPELLRGARAIVNLNGASIGKLPWTTKYRETLRDSRLAPTRTLATALRELGDGAPTLVSASAVGLYGSRPGVRLTETSPAGATFLAKLSEEWEAAALSAAPSSHVALVRTAPLLHPNSVLKPLMALTRLGLGGPLGGGHQIWPWISLEDEVRGIRHVIDRGLTGPINFTGPEPASANDIGRELASQMHRPFLVPAPAWALRLVLGSDAADSLLLADASVEPRALLQSGFEFRHPMASTAIAAALRQ